MINRGMAKGTLSNRAWVPAGTLCIGGLLGGVLAGVCFGLVGQLIGARFEGPAAGVLVGCLAVLATAELVGFRRLWMPPQRNRETPRQWVDWSPNRWALATGAVLGSGVLTRIGFAVWYVVPVAVITAGSPILAGIIAFGSYGLLRILFSLTLFTTRKIGQRVKAIPKIGLIWGHLRVLRIVSSIAALIAGGLIVVVAN